MTDAERIKRLLNWITEPAKCKACGRMIWFVTTKKGKLMPVTDEGEPHFADCPAAKAFQKSQK